MSFNIKVLGLLLNGHQTLLNGAVNLGNTTVATVAIVFFKVGATAFNVALELL